MKQMSLSVVVLLSAIVAAAGCTTFRYKREYASANGAGRPDSEVAVFRSSDAWRIIRTSDGSVQFQQGPKPHDQLIRLLPGEYMVSLGMFEPIDFVVRMEARHVYEVRAENHVMWSRLGHRTDYWIHDVTNDRAISDVQTHSGGMGQGP